MMVGEGEKSILRARKEGSKSEDEGQNASYSRRKKDKKACKFATDDDVNLSCKFNHNQMVDTFVQEVIDRAKNEYLSLYVNHQGNVTTHHERKEGSEQVEDRLLENIPKKDKTVQKKSGKDKSRRKHHYRYSDPVDAREISAYDEEERDSLLDKSGGGSDGHPCNSEPGGLYDRTMLTFRRLLGCCIGKT